MANPTGNLPVHVEASLEAAVAHGAEKLYLPFDAQSEAEGATPSLRNLLAPSKGRDERSMREKHREWHLRQQQEYQSEKTQDPQSQHEKYRAIGCGTLAIVRHLPGTAYVLKHANLPNDVPSNAQLMNDAIMHKQVESAFIQYMKRPGEPEKPPIVLIPCSLAFIQRGQPASCVAKDHNPAMEQSNEDVLISERIPPIPFGTRSALIARFCPLALAEIAMTQDANQDSLIRIYLGKRRDQPVLIESFSLRNYPLCLDQMQELGLETATYASAMGESLAILHWQADCDAKGVEFVLGGTPSPLPIWVDSASRDLGRGREMAATSMWLLDFDQCHPLAVETMRVDNAVHAFFDNDPYYPRPFDGDAADQKVWLAFQETYLNTSHQILGESQLPDIFIDTVIQESLRRSELRINAGEQSDCLLGGHSRGE
ncbi:MAG: hypothetical protein Q9163_005721 [Psora crenata]